MSSETAAEVEVDRWAGSLTTEQDYAAFYAAFRLTAITFLRGKERAWDDSIIEDIAHNAWVCLYNKIGQIDHARAYLFQTLNYKLTDERRHRRRIQPHDLQSIDLDLPEPPVDDPADVAALPAILEQIQDELREVLLAVFQLPERPRDAYRLRVTQRMSSAEIAEVLGCSVAAVDTAVSRARATLTARFSVERISRFESVTGRPR